MVFLVLAAFALRKVRICARELRCMPRSFPARSWFGVVLIIFLMATRSASGLTIDFDYTYDTNGFFTANPQAKTLLNDAAEVFENRLSDSLSAITPGTEGSITDTWTTDAFNPSDPSNASANITVTDLSIAANTIIIYVGGTTSLSGSELGLGGFGGENSSGTTNWNNTVQARGQTGALSATPTDFGPWGGSIAFSSTAAWYFDTGTFANNAFASNAVPGGEFDFFSVATHELGHVLGIGTAPSFQDKIVSGNFTGTNATRILGHNPVLSPDMGHWAEGTMSDAWGTNVGQEVAMDPTLIDGTRKYFTTLDAAGLEDVGWQVALVPEPTVWPWAAAMGATSAITWRKKRQRVRRAIA